VRGCVPGLELKYNKLYMDLASNRRPNNFVVFRPQKHVIWVEPRLARSEDLGGRLEAAGLDSLEYDNRWDRYRLRVDRSDLKKHADLLR